MEIDLQNLLQFCPQVADVRYAPKLDGTPKAFTNLGIPFDETDFMPTEIGANDSFYIGFPIPQGLTIVQSLIKYSDGSIETFEPEYDPINHTIVGFTNNLPQTVLIKTI